MLKNKIKYPLVLKKMFLKYVSPFYEDSRPVKIFLFHSQLRHWPAVWSQKSHLSPQDPTVPSGRQRAAWLCTKETPGVLVEETNPQTVPKTHQNRISRRSTWTMESASCLQKNLESSHIWSLKSLLLMTNYMQWFSDLPGVSLDLLNLQISVSWTGNPCTCYTVCKDL